MADISIEADAFGRTMEQILEKLDRGVNSVMPSEVESALGVGEKAWKSNARAVLSATYSIGGWGRTKTGKVVHFKSGKHKGQVKSGWYGKTIKTGKYARSIKHHMLSQSGGDISGEIGSASLPGLAHLLEKGHASVGGGSVGPKVHIEPAAVEAFDSFERGVDSAVDGVLNDL